MTRITSREVIVKQGADVFRKRVRITDAAFVDMFDFDILKGDISKLSNQKFEADRMDVTANYTQALGLEIIDGSALQENYESDKTKY